MSTRFQRRITLAKGITLNIGKDGVSVSVGTRGARITAGPGRDTRASIGMPGTGFSYLTNFSADARRQERQESKARRDRAREQERSARQQERERKRREREKAQELTAQQKEQLAATWRAEVQSCDGYLEELTSFHHLDVNTEAAREEFARRREPKTYEPDIFHKKNIEAFVINREGIKPVHNNTDKSSSGDISSLLEGSFQSSFQYQDYKKKIRKRVLYFAGAWAASILIAFVRNKAAIEPAIVTFLLMAIVYGISVAYSMRSAKLNYRKDLAELHVAINTEQQREKNYIEEKTALEQAEAKREIEFAAEQAQNAELFVAKELARIELLQKAADGNLAAISLLCEALLPLDIDLDGPEWAESSLLKTYSAGFSVKSPEEVRLLLELPDIPIVPEYTAVISPAGRSITYPFLSAKRRNALYDSFAASFSLCHAQLLYLTYPFFKKINIEAYVPVVDEATGNLAPRTILQGELETAQFDQLTFSQTNPIEVLRHLGATFSSISLKSPLLKTIEDEDIEWASVEDEGMPEGLLPEL